MMAAFTTQNYLAHCGNAAQNTADLPIVWVYLAHCCSLECSEKYKSFKLKIPQPDSERCHSPDFRPVFGIMIGPFSSCEIGKT